MYLPGPGSSFMTGLLWQGCGVGYPGFLFPMPAKELRVSLSEAPDDLTSWGAGDILFFSRNELVSDCVVYTRVCLSYLGDRRPPKTQQYVSRSTVNAQQQRHQIPKLPLLETSIVCPYYHINARPSMHEGPRASLRSIPMPRMPDTIVRLPAGV